MLSQDKGAMDKGCPWEGVEGGPGNNFGLFNSFDRAGTHPLFLW